MDGTPTLRMNEFIVAVLAANKINLGPELNESTGANLPDPVELRFQVDSQVEHLIRGAEERFDKLVAAHDLQVRQPYCVLS
jgi:carnitine O-acetyltransferase